MVDDQAVAVMHTVAARCTNEEKMAWTLAYLLEHQPREKHSLQVLANVLHDHLADTIFMIRSIPVLREDDG